MSDANRDATLAPFDPGTMPLTGVRLVEASAGTGKTFSLAGLYLRLIVEQQLDVRDILVMTFTRAATQELRERLRARLAQAARIAADPGGVAADEAAGAFTEAVIAASPEARTATAQRLRAAATRIDEATITTIHGFAQRAAAENAFASALPFDRGDPVDDREVAREASADYWRSRVFATTGTEGRVFLNLWPDPESLWQDLRRLVDQTHARMLQPDPTWIAADLRGAREKWNREQFCAHMAEALERDGLYKGKGLRNQLEALGPEGLADRIEIGLTGTRDGHPVIPALLADLADEVRVGNHVKKTARKWCQPEALPAMAELGRLATDGRALALATAVDDVRTRCRERKRERRLFSFADMIEQLHTAITDPAGGPALATALRTTWPWALVDESQDTDPLQYTILQRIYRPEAESADGPEAAEKAPGEARNTGGLILVGDPKQAIYGFRGGDVFTFLAAARDADGRYGMTTNFRSTPEVVAGVNALFAAGGDETFVLDGIDFQPVSAQRAAGDRRIELDGKTVGGVTAWHPTTDPETGGSTAKNDCQARIRAATVERIAALLARGHLDVNDEKRPLRPGEIAVLVNTNREAAAMQTALGAAGVPAICIQQDSVFAREAAVDLLRLLQAAASPLDGDRLRVALITPLFGLRLGDLMALDQDEAAWADWTDHFQQLHADWLRRGIQAMLEPVLQAAAARVGGRDDGERRLTDYLHITDRLQEAERETFGPDGLVGWLATAINEADGEGDAGDADRLRLADDAELVQVTTVHKAKGLQFPVVFVPYAPWIGTADHARPDSLPLRLHDAAGQALIDPGLTDSDKRIEAAIREHRAEQMRSLYVALTRAEQACVFAHCAANCTADGPLAWLLHHGEGATLERWHGSRSKPPAWLTDDNVRGRLTVAAEASDGGLQAAPLPEPTATPADVKRTRETPLGPARTDLPAPRPHWGISSFSGLAGRMNARAEPTAGADDPVDLPLAHDGATDVGGAGPIPLTPRGPGFGQAVHDLLEASDFERWPRPGAKADGATAADVAASLRRHGVAPGEGADSNVSRTLTMLGATVHTPLPGIGPLAAIPPARRRAEMEFFLRLGGAQVEDVLACIAAAGHAGARAPGATARLRGLMHGYIDLVVENEGRYWLLDYKTNALGPQPADYAPAKLARAVRESHYDLQYLIYSVALHRHLRQHLADYAPARHLGGVLYLFVRGLGDGPAGGRNDEGQTGIFHDHPDPELIDALDAHLDGALDTAGESA